eukprot:GEMP01008012.1.p1 GENE.GEMP01008012.1~~GEMP01008012.1.p1  ORF type:complete len:675 (+),score=172.14 GEMP01008012.1:840-2864(+)
MSFFSGTLQDVCVSIRSIITKQGHDGPKWDIMGKEVSYQIGPKGVTLHIKDESSYPDSEEQVPSCAKPVMDECSSTASYVDGASDPYATTAQPSPFSPSAPTTVLSPRDRVPAKRRTRARARSRTTTDWREEDPVDAFPTDEHSPFGEKAEDATMTLDEERPLPRADVARKRARRHRSRRDPSSSRHPRSASALSPSTMARRQVDAQADSADVVDENALGRGRRVRDTTLAVHNVRGGENADTMLAVGQLYGAEESTTALPSTSPPIKAAVHVPFLLDADARSSDEDAISSLRTRARGACRSSHGDETSVEARPFVEQDRSCLLSDVPALHHKAPPHLMNEHYTAAAPHSSKRIQPVAESSADVSPYVPKKRGRPRKIPDSLARRRRHKLEPDELPLKCRPRRQKLDQSSDSSQSTAEPRLSDTDSSKPTRRTKGTARTAQRTPDHASRRTVTGSKKTRGKSKAARRTVTTKREKKKINGKTQLPLCGIDNCSSIAKGRVHDADKFGPPGYRCITHGGGRRCCAANCTNSAKGRISVADADGEAGPRCIRHGGGLKCSVEGCERAKHGRVNIPDVFGQLGPRCTRHGGGPRCSATVVGGCANSAVSFVDESDAFGPSGIRCKRHGGGRRCSVVGCETAGRGQPVTEADYFGPPGFRCGRHGASMLMPRNKEQLA